MLYYKDNEWQICPLIAHYTAHGKREHKYTNDRRWWERFVQRWWHTESLTFEIFIPTQVQIDRLAEVRAAKIPEIYGSETSAYVERGEVPEDNPVFEKFRAAPDHVNTIERYYLDDLRREEAISIMAGSEAVLSKYPDIEDQYATKDA